MSIQTTFKDVKSGPEVLDRIEKKSGKFQRLFNKKLNIRWVFWREKEELCSEVRVSGYHGPVMLAKASGQNLFKAIDLATQKMQGQLKKMKAKN